MDDMGELFRQFNHGEGEWKQFVNSIRISNIHGWNGQEIKFMFPVVAIVGENGIGKSTFLKAAVCAYENNSGNNFYPSNMFIKTQWDSAAINNAEIEYKVRQGDDTKTLRWKKTNDWGFSPKRGKPKRNVYFLDISRTLPLDATAGYAKIAKNASAEGGENTELSVDSLKALSYVLGNDYTRGRFTGTDVRADREVGLLTKPCGEISQFHQGAGEDVMLDTFKLFQSIAPQSLLVIDEVENSLHPLAQRRFVKYLLKIARVKKLQIILSTHSPFILEELPPVARIMMLQLADRKEIIYNVSTEFALSAIDDIIHPEIHIFLEDNEAVALFWEIIRHQPDKFDEISRKVVTKAVGAYNVLETLGTLAGQNKLPYKSLSIVDGDKRGDCPHCFSLPGDLPPEILVFQGLKRNEWKELDARFGIGAGSLFKYLDDAMLLPDHHKWTTYVGDKIKKSKDTVWSILIDEWCRQCLSEDDMIQFVDYIERQLPESI